MVWNGVWKRGRIGEVDVIHQCVRSIEKKVQRCIRHEIARRHEREHAQPRSRAMCAFENARDVQRISLRRQSLGAIPRKKQQHREIHERRSVVGIVRNPRRQGGGELLSIGALVHHARNARETCDRWMRWIGVMPLVWLRSVHSERPAEAARPSINVVATRASISRGSVRWFTIAARIATLPRTFVSDGATIPPS